MKPVMQSATSPRLDPAKLFGFRNLVVVTDPEVDLRATADLAFTKRGTEGATA